MMDGFKQYEGKRVFVSLKSKRFYSGVVKEIVDLGNGLIFIGITDKFGNFVSIATGEIEFIEEQEEKI